MALTLFVAAGASLSTSSLTSTLTPVLGTVTSTLGSVTSTLGGLSVITPTVLITPGSITL